MSKKEEPVFKSFLGKPIKTEDDRLAVQVFWGILGAGMIVVSLGYLGILKVENKKVPVYYMSAAERAGLEAKVAPYRNPVNFWNLMVNGKEVHPKGPIICPNPNPDAEIRPLPADLEADLFGGAK